MNSACAAQGDLEAACASLKQTTLSGQGPIVKWRTEREANESIIAPNAPQRLVLVQSIFNELSTPRNCTTGDPIPAAAFEALYTFHRDGTMISWYSSGTPSTGQGLWRRELGWSDYSFKLVRLLRTPTGVFSGKQEIGGTLALGESGDEYTSDEYMIVYSLDGVPGTPFCINSVGKRFTFDN